MSKSSRHRILFIAGCWYPDEDHPIHGVFIRRHAEAVAQLHDVGVLHPLPSSDDLGTPFIRERDFGRVHEYHILFPGGTNRKGGGLRSQLGYFRAGLYGCRKMKKEGFLPDILHFHVIPSLGLTLAVKIVFPGRPVILTEHWTGYIPESGVSLSRARRLYTARLARRSAAFTVVSRYHENIMRSQGFDAPYVVIPNVTDMRVFRQSDEKREGPFRFVHVSGIRKVKRVPDIVRAAVETLRGGHDIEVHIVGSGPDSEAAQRVAREAGDLGDKVVFHGELDDQGVARVVRSCDCSVLFSDFENSPCVVGEALACGLPMLATRIAGIPEHITAERGMLVPLGDLNAFTAAMAYLAQKGRSWDSHAIRAYAEETFSQERIARLFDDVYANALRAGGEVECR